MSNEIAQELRATSSPQEVDDYWDVLPSFQMHQSILNRNLSQIRETFPYLPDYVESSPSISPFESNNSLNGATTNGTSINDLYDGPENGPASQSVVMNNLEKLKSSNIKGIKTDIFVTKNPMKVHEKNESQHMLKEYISGDLIHGYVVVENTTDQSVPFEMFTVSLEGNIVMHQQGNKITKNFLRSFDLSASFNYGMIPSSSKIDFVAHETDRYDNAQIGFRSDKIMKPHKKYKKAFTFRIPHVLLDDSCIHDEPSHSLLPPSFGINRKFFKGRTQNITSDPILGYGFIEKRGSPVITDDGSFTNSSVSYSIEVKMIDRTKGVSSSVSEDSLSIMSEASYFLRFIPWGFCQPMISESTCTNEIDNICKEIEQKIQESKRQLLMPIQEESEDDIIEQERSNNSAKSKQLYPSSTSGVSFPLQNKEDKKIIIESMKTVKKQKPSFISKLFSPKSKIDEDTNKESDNQQSLIIISSKIPKDGIPYISPTIMQKYNTRSNMNGTARGNLDSLHDSLTTNEKRDLQSFVVDLEYLAGDDSILPKIETVTANLLALTVESQYPIPCKLAPDLFIDDDDLNSNGDGFLKITDLKHKFNNYFSELNSLPTQNSIPRVILNNIKSILSLEHKVKSVPLFKIVDYKSSKWEKKNNSQGNESSYQKKLLVGISLNKIGETLVPTFQTCMISRMYCIQIRVEFSNLGNNARDNTVLLHIPIRFRQFDI